MSRYVLVETTAHPESPEVTGLLGMAVALAQGGRTVTLWLMQNGVLLMAGEPTGAVRTILETPGVTVFADELALRQRGLSPQAPHWDAVRIAGMDVFVSDLMELNSKVIWH